MEYLDYICIVNAFTYSHMIFIIKGYRISSFVVLIPFS